MTRVAVLLRGVNVGRHRRVAMPAFAGVVERCGAREVRTHLQSGNAVADWPGEPAELAERVRAALDADLGLDVPVLVRTAGELAGTVAATPYGDPEDPSLVHVAFLDRPPDPEALARLDPGRFAPDELVGGDGVLYLRYRNGSQRSRLSLAALEKRLGVVATARNWTTVLALRDLTAG